MRNFIAAWILVGATLAAYFFGPARAENSRNTADARLWAEVQLMIGRKLSTLPPDDPIVRRYGPLQSWQPGDGGASRSRHARVSRFECAGVAHFQKADGDVEIVLSAGPKDVSLELEPSDDYVHQHPNVRLEIADLTMIVKDRESQWPAVIRAHASHPAFVAR